MEQIGTYLMWGAIAIIVLLFLVHLWKTKKEPRLADVAMVTGGVKTGKTSLSVAITIRRYKKELRRYAVKKWICYAIGKRPPERPLYYSNIPVAFEYVPLTLDILLRKTRLAYRSVCYISEASLLADGMDWKDEEVNEQIKLFCKLYGHETRGGCLVFDTQAIKDVHYNIKRSLNTYLWVQRTIKWIPFILVFKVREMYYSEESGVVNTFNEDVDETMKWLVCRKKVWKLFDCYCYSAYTDNLPVERNTKIGVRRKLKAEILTFKKEKKQCENSPKKSKTSVQQYVPVSSRFTKI